MRVAMRVERSNEPENADGARRHHEPEWVWHGDLQHLTKARKDLAMCYLQCHTLALSA